MSGVVSVLLVGVGGQGTILAGDVLAKVATASGLDVKLSEVHGMSQRGGSVDTTVRFGNEVHSPVIDRGGADHLVAFEMIEAARGLPFLRPGGTLLVNDRTIQPLPVLTGALPRPSGLAEKLAGGGATFVDADALACEAGTPRSANVVLLGALSVNLPFEEAVWREAIGSRVPKKTIDANLRAFELGRLAATKGEGTAT